MFLSDEPDFSVKDDHPKWKTTEVAKRSISIDLGLDIDKDHDAGLFQFLTTYLSIDTAENTLRVTISAQYGSDPKHPTVTVKVGEDKYDGFKAQEILSKLRSSRIILFHNSTSATYDRFGLGTRLVSFVSGAEQDQNKITELKQTVNRGLKKIAKGKQREIEELLGKLEDKYRVGLSLPPFDFEYMPFGITLGDQKVEVPLEDWGSGTKNRTLILVLLLRAQKIKESAPAASKVTPILIVEEPESFLHPSAQAEFARVLQNLAEDFRVQVITTTHSPYMLSNSTPEANILLQRNMVRGQLRDTVRVATTGDRWMEPFGIALGIDNTQFGPWKRLFFSDAKSTLLVEGEIDKEYFELLQGEEHGPHAILNLQEIFAYGGCDSLRNTLLLRFVKNRCKNTFITFDLDALQSVEPTLTSLGLVRGIDYAPIGLDEAGKRSIEGLLPDQVRSTVFAKHHDLVQQAMNGSKDEQRSAKAKLKKHLLEEFKTTAAARTDHFKHFYAITKMINRAMASQRNETNRSLGKGP